MFPRYAEKFSARKFFNFASEHARRSRTGVMIIGVSSRILETRGEKAAGISLRPRAINFTNSLAVARATQKARCDETGLRLGPLIATRSRKYVLLAIRSARKRSTFAPPCASENRRISSFLHDHVELGIIVDRPEEKKTEKTRDENISLRNGSAWMRNSAETKDFRKSFLKKILSVNK